MTFSASTQHQNWTFSIEALKQQKEDALRNVRQWIPVPHEPVVLQVLFEEAEQLKLYWIKKIREVCAKSKYPHSIQATAIAYFKRFYLRNSIIDFEPKHIMLTCIFLACKIEEHPINSSKFAVLGDTEFMLELELRVASDMNFQLLVFHPYRSLTGFCADIVAALPSLQNKINKSVELEARELIDRSMFTDAAFLFSPSQIALAALQIVAAKHEIDCSSYLEARFPGDPQLDELNSRLSAVAKLMTNVPKPNPALIRSANERLKNHWKKLYDTWKANQPS